MKQVAVADATPLITLSRLGRLGILKRLFSEILVPSAVWKELTKNPRLPGAREVASAEWVSSRRVRVSESLQVLARRWRLKAGETQAIALARELRSRVLLDEDAAVQVARSLRLRVLRLPYLLYVAHSRGVLREPLGVVLDGMQKAGFYMRDEVRKDLLRRAGE